MAIENCTQGTVVVGIIFNETGELLRTEIRSDSILGDGLEDAAMSAVTLISGNWCPGLIACEAIENEYVFPVRFKLIK